MSSIVTAIESGEVSPEEGAEVLTAAADAGRELAETLDVDPDEGKQEYGDVSFADPTNKKYPIDTEGHVRAAWSYINKKSNADKYDSDEVDANHAFTVDHPRERPARRAPRAVRPPRREPAR